MRRLGLRMPVVLMVAAVTAACGPVSTEPEWPPLAKKWYERAEASYRQVDVEDAQLAIDNALRIEPERAEVRLLAARIALAQLEYDQAIRYLEGADGKEALGIRGRAYWYSGQIEKAADELEQLLGDPDVRDAWAREVAKLARNGSGREPFRTSGGILAVTEMPQVGAPVMLVPVELDGEPALALVSTSTAEVVLDSSTGRRPSWVSLRFGERLEVKDVPALTKDLSGISRQLNAPVKLLLGVNLLRHLRATVDYQGGQFVVRTFDPPAPAQLTAVRLAYIRGGGMVLRSTLGRDAETGRASLLVDTGMQFPVALKDAGWRKAGVDISTMEPVPNGGGLRHGIVPSLQIGGFDVPEIPGVLGVPLDEFEKGLGVELDGMIGTGLLAAFRVTLVDGGRTMWLEDTPPLPAGAPRGAAEPGPGPMVPGEPEPPGQLQPPPGLGPGPGAPPAAPGSPQG